MTSFSTAILSLIIITIVSASGVMINGTTEFLPGQEDVNISCNVETSTSVENVYAMTITKGRIPITSVNKNGAYLNNGTDLAERASLQGSVVNASSAYLSLSIPANITKSIDASLYICKLVGATTQDKAYSPNASMTVVLKDHPSAMIMTGTTSLKPEKENVYISCVSRSTPPLKTIYAIQMFRGKTPIAHVTVNGAVWNYGSDLSGRALLEGSVSNTSNAYLNLTIPASKTKFSDAKPYRCNLVGATAEDGAYSTSVFVNISSEVTPVTSGVSRVSDNFWGICLILITTVTAGQKC